MRTINCWLTAALIAIPMFAAPQKGKSARGEEIFQEQCSGCHGPDGRAQTEMAKKVQAADLTSDAVRSMSASQIAKQVHQGKGKMPPFEGKLSDAEIHDVVAYVQGLGKKQ